MDNKSRMPLKRRRFLAAPAVVMAFSEMVSTAARATDNWPIKPVRLLVPYATGTPPDIASRLIAGHLGSALGKPFYAENKPGAIGLVALAEMLRQPADGHTLFCMSTPVTTAGVLLPAQRIDLQANLTPVSQIDWSQPVLVVSNDVKAADVAGLRDLLRANPGQFSFASGGNGTPAHLAAELFKQQQGVQAAHVPYAQFSQVIPDIIAGRIQFMFLVNSVALPLVQAGKLRAIGVVGEKRLASLPDVPTLAEQGMGDFDVRNWDGLVVKAGTPPAIVSRLSETIRSILQRPEVGGQFMEAGMIPQPSTPQAFGDLILKEQIRWSRVIREARISVE